MERNKTSFCRDFFKKLDGILALVVGCIFGIGIFYLFRTNILGSLLPGQYVEAARTGLTVVYLAILVLSIAAVIPFLFKKYTTKGDFLLTFFIAACATLFGFTLGYDKEFKTNSFVYFALLAVGLIFLIIRMAEVREVNDEKGDVKNYFASLYSHFNPVVFILSGLIVGIILALIIIYTDVFGFIGDVIPAFAALSTGRKLLVFGIIALALAVIFLILCIFKKMRKVNFLDILLAFAMYMMIGVGLYFGLQVFLNGVKAINNHFLGVYLTLTYAVMFLTAFRALIVEKGEINDKKGLFAVYFGQVFNKFSLTPLAAVGLVLAAGLIYVDYSGFRAFNATRLNMLAYLSTLLVALVLLVMFFIGLFTKKMVCRKINVIDFAIVSLAYAGVFLSFDVAIQFRTYTLIGYLALFVIWVIVVFLRAKYFNQALLAEDIPYVETTEEELEEITPEEEKSIESEEPVLEATEEEPVAEPVTETVEKVEETIVEEKVETPTETVVAEAKETAVVPTTIETRPIIKRTFINKLKFTSDKTKGFYSEIKNALLQYGATSRLTSKNETFRKRGLLAKLSVAGKTLRIHLALDPTDARFEEDRYHQFSLAERKAYKDVPFTMKVKSGLACKRALELIDILCGEVRRFRFKRNFEAFDYVPTLDVDGDAIFEKLGITDLMVSQADETYSEKFGKDGLPSVNKICSLIPVKKVEDGLNHNDGEEVNVYVETALKYVPGKVISTETLKEVNNIALDVQRIFVKMHEAVTEPITVICDDIDLPVAVAILATHGKVMFYTPKEFEVEDDNRPLFTTSEEDFSEDEIDDGEDDDDEEDREEGEVTEITPAAENADNSLKIRRTPFASKLFFISEKSKHYYSEIKNALLSYGCSSRLVFKNEAFRKSGLVAKISVSGKTLRLHLALDPNDPTLPLDRYHQFSLADKAAYKDVPFTVKIKSDLAFKRSLELVRIVCEGRGLGLTSTFVHTDYEKDLTPSGKEIFEKLNLSDKMTNHADFALVGELGESVPAIMSLIPVKEKEHAITEEMKSLVYLDTLEGVKKITLETLKEINAISLDTTILAVDVHGDLDKKLYIECDEISDAAAVMVLALGGTVVLTK